MRTAIRQPDQTPWETSQDGTDRARGHCCLCAAVRPTMANAMIEQSGVRIGDRPPPRPRRRHQSDRPLRADLRATSSTTAGNRSRNCRRSRPRCRSRSRARSSPATNRPTFPSTARSIPIAAASMAASTASRGRRTPIWACRRGSISSRSCSPSRMRRRLLERELAKPGYEPRTIAIGTNTDPYQPIEKQYRIMREILEVLEAHEPSGRHRHQVGAGDARHRHLVAHGRARTGQGGAVGDDARPQAGAHDGAARGDADQAAGGDPAAVRGRHPDLGDGGADHSRR